MDNDNIKNNDNFKKCILLVSDHLNSLNKITISSNELLKYNNIKLNFFNSLFMILGF